MEDTSYVNLSLKKYNELYDKAKKYDELTKELGDKISESINKVVDEFNKMFTNNEEETTEEPKTEEVEDTEFKVGDKIMVVGTIVKDDKTDMPYLVSFSTGNYNWFRKEDIKKIKEEK